MKLLIDKQIIIIFSVIILANSSKPVKFINGGYRGLVIAIHSEVPESEQLIKNLEELIRKSSAFLYKATDRRARFVEVEVIIPETWSKKDDYESIAGSHFSSAHVRIAPTDPSTGDEPYTYQPRGCGQPGEYIRFTDAFIEELNGKTKDNFGHPEKHFIHEWAHYRYGVFDEYGIPGDSKYPTFYMENGTIHPTTCVKGIKGRQEDSNGKTCKIYSGGKVDPKCRFIADKYANEAKASIMFMPHIDSIDKFCQNDANKPKLLHNKFAPNKQNILCGYRSTSEVIEEHKDFKNQNIKSLSDKYYEPAIRLLRIDSEQSSRFVLVLDVSGSMKDNGRIKLLNRAATRFVNDLIPRGFELGIIEFATNATVLHSMVTINDTTRNSLAAKVPTIAEGWTAVGKGFRLALDILRESGNTRGATIILVSDGQENQKNPTIEEIMPEVLESGVRVDTIAVAIDADKRLENISYSSGGKCFYMKDSDDATNNLMETAFLGSVSQQSDIEIQSVTILSRDLTIVGGRAVHKKVIIDSELGKNTKFMISTNDVDKVMVTFKAPDGQTFTESHPYFKRERELKNIQLSVPNSPVGDWEVIFNRDVRHNRDVIVAMTVLSEPKNPKQQPIRVNAYFGKLEVRYPATAMIYAEVRKGQNAIIEAKVVATVDRPEAEKIEVNLYDDGSGADMSASDGIYSAAFTEFSQNGRYSVSAKITTLPAQTRIRTTRSHYAFSRSVKGIKNLRTSSTPEDSKSEFEISDFISSSGKPDYAFEAKPIPEFTRVSEVGAFKVDNFKPNIDLMAPGRVTNLQVVTTDEDNQIVELQWTAPGDDSYTGNATKIDLRAALSQEALHMSKLFPNTLAIDQNMLVAGSLVPAIGGSIMRAKFQIPQKLYKFAKIGGSDKSAKLSIYFALRAVDDSNNTGDISNIAFVHFGYVKPVFDNIIIGTNSRPFETTVIQTHILLPNPVLFHHNRILVQKLKNQTSVKIPKELGRNTRFSIVSDDIDFLTVSLTSPNGTVYSMTSVGYKYYPSEMMIEFQIPLANAGKWKVRFQKLRKETAIAYLSVMSESRVDEPVKVKAWMDTPFTAKDKPLTAVINAEVTKRYNYIICADVLAIVDRPKGEPISVQLLDNGLGADKVANDGLYSGVFTKFNTNGRYAVNARIINNNKAMLKLGVEDERRFCL